MRSVIILSERCRVSNNLKSSNCAALITSGSLQRVGPLPATTVQIKPSPLVYLSPRGLISILLFLQLKDISFVDLSLSPIDERVLLIVILGTMLVMLLGTLKKSKASQREDFAEDESHITVETQLDQPHTSDEETEDSLN